jgi:predicted RNA binding protein with dsRBD fold (UPF0201 family)
MSYLKIQNLETGKVEAEVGEPTDSYKIAGPNRKSIPMNPFSNLIKCSLEETKKSILAMGSFIDEQRISTTARINRMQKSLEGKKDL